MTWTDGKRMWKYCEDCNRYFKATITASKHRRMGHKVRVTKCAVEVRK